MLRRSRHTPLSNVVIIEKLFKGYWREVHQNKLRLPFSEILVSSFQCLQLSLIRDNLGSVWQHLVLICIPKENNVSTTTKYKTALVCKGISGFFKWFRLLLFKLYPAIQWRLNRVRHQVVDPERYCQQLVYCAVHSSSEHAWYIMWIQHFLLSVWPALRILSSFVFLHTVKNGFLGASYGTCYCKLWV